MSKVPLYITCTCTCMRPALTYVQGLLAKKDTHRPRVLR